MNSTPLKTVILTGFVFFSMMIVSNGMSAQNLHGSSQQRLLQKRVVGGGGGGGGGISRTQLSTFKHQQVRSQQTSGMKKSIMKSGARGASQRAQSTQGSGSSRTQTQSYYKDQPASSYRLRPSGHR